MFGGACQPVGVYVQVGMGQMECYERDFEEFLLKDTAEYYKRKAAAWIQVRIGGALPGAGYCWHPLKSVCVYEQLQNTAERWRGQYIFWVLSLCP